MISQQQNLGYSMPQQLSDRSWRKCLQFTQDPSPIYKGIISIRQYLSQSTQINNLICNLLQTQIHKSLIKYAKKIFSKVLNEQASQIQYQCLYQIIWIFTNLCSGNRQTTNRVIQIGIVAFCKDCFTLNTPYYIISILFQLLGNLAGQINLSVKMAFLTDQNFYNFMKYKYKDHMQIANFQQNASWAFHNLFRDLYPSQKNKFQVPQQIILSYIPIIQELLEYGNQQSKVNLLYIFFYITKDEPFNMSQILRIAQKYLFEKNEQITSLVIQIVGNFVSLCDQAVDYVLKNPQFILILLQNMKNSHKVKSRKQAAWIVSNVFAGSHTQVEKFVTFPLLFVQLKQIIIKQSTQSVLKQIIWSISNCYSTCSQKAFQIIFYSSIIEVLSIKLNNCKDFTIYNVYLQGITHYLKKFQQNANLDFRMFIQNLVYIKQAFNVIESKHLPNLMIQTKIQTQKAKIQQLLKRGPITEEEIVNIKMQKFTI